MKKKHIKYFLITLISIIIFIKYKQSRKLPIEFKFEKIENDNIVVSSTENLAVFGEKKDAKRYTLICPISNEDRGFSDNTNNEVSIETELERDYSGDNSEYPIVKKVNDRYYYGVQISIWRKTEQYEARNITNKEIIGLIKKKGNCLQCNIGLMYYFFPLPKYSESFCIPSDSLISYLENKK